MRTRRVVVVGAGIAGLGAARRLLAKGYDVSVLELESRPGGRLVSEVREGFVLEPGAQVLSNRDRRVADLLAELGLANEALVLGSVGLGQLHRGWVHDIDPRGLRGIARLPGVRWSDALRTVRLTRLIDRFGAALDPSEPERAAPHDDRSVSDFARLYFGRSVAEHWVDPFVSAASLADPRETSRIQFLLHYLHERGSLPLVLRGGAGRLTARMAERATLESTAEVTRIDVGESDGALVRFRRAGLEGTIGADAVVVATPAATALRLSRSFLVTAEREFLGAVRYRPAITLAVAIRQPLIPRTALVRFPRTEGWPIARIMVEPGVPGSRVPAGCALAKIVAAAEWSRRHLEAPDEAIAKELLAFLARLYPELGDTVRFTAVARYPLALPCFDVGAYRALARFQKLETELRAQGRRVYFAGDYRVGPSVEAALASGQRAADEIVADFSPKS